MNKSSLLILAIFIVIMLGVYEGAKRSTQQLKTQDPQLFTSPSPSALIFLNSSPQPQGSILPNSNFGPDLPNHQKPVKQYRQFPGILAKDELQNKKAIIQTNKGNIEFAIYPEATTSASNFIFLAKDGFYDGQIFFQIQKDWAVWAGDPLGNGTGNAGYFFGDQPLPLRYNKGAVAMYNQGASLNSSQFFILTEDHLEIAKQYPIFGRVILGGEIVTNIEQGDTIQKILIVAETP